MLPYKNRQKNAKNIGVVFGQRTQLWWDIPLNETYTLLKNMYDISDEDYEERYKFLDDVLGLSEFIMQPVRTLSLGQRMKADIAAALLHNPKVIFLDEPTIGLDVVVKESCGLFEVAFKKIFQEAVVQLNFEDRNHLLEKEKVIGNAKV